MSDEPPPLPPWMDCHRSPDSIIRDAGFVIVARPEGCQARWRRGRVIYLQEGALAIAKRERREALERLESKSGK